MWNPFKRNLSTERKEFARTVTSRAGMVPEPSRDDGNPWELFDITEATCNTESWSVYHWMRTK